MKARDMPTNLPRVMVSLSDDLLKQLDDYRRKQEKIPSRSEAIRRLIEDALSRTKTEHSQGKKSE